MVGYRWTQVNLSVCFLSTSQFSNIYFLGPFSLHLCLGRPVKVKQWTNTGDVEGKSHKKHEKKLTWEVIRDKGVYSYIIDRNPKYTDAMRARDTLQVEGEEGSEGKGDSEDVSLPRSAETTEPASESKSKGAPSGPPKLGEVNQERHPRGVGQTAYKCHQKC